MDRTDPRSDFVIDTRSLGRRPGTMQQLTRTATLTDDLGTDVIAVPAGQPVELDVRLESVVEGVLVTGTVTGTARGACVRCLEPVELEIDSTYQELFAYPDRAAHHHDVGVDSDEDGVYELDGDLVDLEPVLRDAVVPTLPFQPVCRQDCPGLCSECGVRLVEDPGHTHETIDPRWSKLGALLGGDEEPASQAQHMTQQEKRN